MRPHCPAIRHFRNCHGNISSLRRSLTFKARWSDRLERRLHKRRSSGSSLMEQLWFLIFLSLSPFFFVLPFQFFFPPNLSHIINLLLHSFWVGQYRGIFSSREAVLSLPVVGPILPPSN